MDAHTYFIHKGQVSIVSSKSTTVCRELMQKRKEKGLIAVEEDESVVHAHCTMRRFAPTSCVKGDQDCEIRGRSLPAT